MSSPLDSWSNRRCRSSFLLRASIHYYNDKKRCQESFRLCLRKAQNIMEMTQRRRVWMIITFVRRLMRLTKVMDQMRIDWSFHIEAFQSLFHFWLIDITFADTCTCPEISITSLCVQLQHFFHPCSRTIWLILRRRDYFKAEKLNNRDLGDWNRKLTLILGTSWYPISVLLYFQLNQFTDMGEPWTRTRMTLSRLWPSCRPAGRSRSLVTCSSTGS